MEFLLGGALLGVVVGASVYFVLQRTTRRELDEVSLLVSGVQGEERLRTLEANVGARLTEIGRIVNEIDRARGESIAHLTGVVSMSQRSIDDLRATTGRLAETLSSNQARGQWGERMADDILRAAGFVEGRNYLRNRQMAGSTGRPDFTFLLPDERTLNMDVKFPIASYVRYIEAVDDTAWARSISSGASTRKLLRLSAAGSRALTEPSNSSQAPARGRCSAGWTRSNGCGRSGTWS
jgi:hypothetical protein